MKTVCQKNMCNGCMACVDKCSHNAISIIDDVNSFNAVIDPTKCVMCKLCEKVCPNNQEIVFSKPLFIQEGYANQNIREKSSSGGVASAIFKSFIENGGWIASCLYKNDNFCFDITNNVEDIVNYIGSKYVKSNPVGIHKKIVEKLKNKEKVLFLGLPCQVAGLLNYISNLKEEYKNNLYTVDLICHGSPSSKILFKCLQEKKINLTELNNIYFRRKNNFNIFLQYNSGKEEKLTSYNTVDMYTYAFLSSLDYTENCYSCKFAKLNRISDITIGDSWGSNLDDEEQKKGVSLILCQSIKGIEIINNSNLTIGKVDVEKSIKFNHQLSHPSIMHKDRERFFKHYNKGFHRAILLIDPKMYIKQNIKALLTKFKILK